MYSEGRHTAAIAAILLCLIVLHHEVAQAATYTVGDARGWTFNVVGWPNGKCFRAGDTLVFKYNSAFHNVVAVNKAGYDSCKTPNRAKVYQKGKDRIRLPRGRSYFICGLPGHCRSGMKIAITAV